MRGKKRKGTGATEETAPSPAYHHTEAGDEGAKVLELHVYADARARVRIGVHYRDDWIATAIQHDLTIDDARALRDTLDAIITTHDKDKQ